MWQSSRILQCQYSKRSVYLLLLCVIMHSDFDKGAICVICMCPYWQTHLSSYSLFRRNPACAAASFGARKRKDTKELRSSIPMHSKHAFLYLHTVIGATHAYTPTSNKANCGSSNSMAPISVGGGRLVTHTDKGELGSRSGFYISI